MSKLSYFMRDIAKEYTYVEVPAPASITDENGKPVMMKVKVLHREDITKIENRTDIQSVATDKKGNPLMSGGKVVYKSNVNKEERMGLILAEALEYPNLKDKELMEFFDCHSIAEMANKVFPTIEEFNQVVNDVYTALGLLGKDDADADKEIEEVKN